MLARRALKGWITMATINVNCAACKNPIGPSDTVYRTRVDRRTGDASKPWIDQSHFNYFEQAPVCEQCRPQFDYLHWSKAAPCAVCGRPLRYIRDRVGATPKACSHQCSLAFSRQKRLKHRQGKICVVCQQPFTPARSDATTCSQSVGKRRIDHE
jgi:hypothetical protein